MFINIDKLNEIIGGKIISIKRKNYKNVKTDTRLVDKNSLLFVFDLSKKNGDNAYNYIKKLKVKPSIIVINEYEEDINDISCIKVKDTILAFSLLASYNKEKWNIPTIVITGSVGKTTTKELISEVLGTTYKCVKTEKSQNSILGVSNTLMNVGENTDILIVELGSNHIGEIKELSNIVKPNIGVITKIGTSHIEYFKNRKQVFLEKTSFIDDLNGGILFINGDDKYLKKIRRKNISVFKIGRGFNNDFKLKKINFKETYIEFELNNINEKFNFNTINKDLILNVCFAIEIGLFFNVPIYKIKYAIENFKFPQGRNNVYFVKDSIIVDDTYNASLESMISSIRALKKYKKDKIIILGDMLELGKSSKNIHKKVLKEALKVSNFVYTYGNNFDYKNNCSSLANVLEKIKELNLNDKVILLKASRKLALDSIVDDIYKLIESRR